MKSFLAPLLLVASPAFAAVGPALLDSIPSKEAANIETLAAKAVQREVGAKLRNFKVDWEAQSNQCVEVKSEMDSSALMGVCTLSFSAYQVTGNVALTKKLNGQYSVTVIDAEVE